MSTIEKTAIPLLLLTIFLVLLSDSVASQCLPSAQSVKHAFPGLWPSWTTRDAEHKGKKCWFPVSHSTRVHVETEPKKIKTETIRPQNNLKLAYTVRNISRTFWDRTSPVEPVTLSSSSFEERFAAAFNYVCVSCPPSNSIY